MPTSLSLDIWQTSRANRLDELEAAHTSIGGASRGRRFATQRINRGYAVLLAAQFQGFCSDLHSECVAAIVRTLPPALRGLATVNWQFGLAMRRGNAGPGNIGNDFDLWEFRCGPTCIPWMREIAYGTRSWTLSTNGVTPLRMMIFRTLSYFRTDLELHFSWRK
jgi:hypothetical protein